MKLTMQKGFTTPLAVVIVVLVASATFFYLGKMSSPKPQLSPPFPPPVGQEAIKQQMKEDEERQKRLSLKSQAELPLIASASVEYALKNGYKNPQIGFASNDGEYATVHLGELDGSGVLLFLVKRDNKWIPLVSSNGNPSCSEALPLREKYSLPKDFLPCAEELD